MSGFVHRLRRHDEAGVSLVEVVLTCLILGIVMGVAFNFLDRASILTARTQAQAQVEDDAQRALRIVTEELRGALPIGSACTTTITFTQGTAPAGYDNCVQFTVLRSTTSLDPCPKTMFVYALVGTGTSKKLMERRMEYTGTATCPASPSSTRDLVILENVVNTTTQPLFTWYRSDGSAINTASAATAVPDASSVKLSIHTTFRNNATTLSFSSVAALRNNINR